MEYWHLVLRRTDVNDELAHWVEDGWKVKKFLPHPGDVNYFDVLMERGTSDKWVPPRGG